MTMFPIRTRPGSTAGRRCRPRLEALEDRCVPALTIHEYATLTPASSPEGIVSYGSVSYFTEYAANKIGVVSADGTSKTEFAIPTADGFPQGITAGPPANSNPWFTELFGNKIGWMDGLGRFTEFDVPTANSMPQAITAGPDGNIWFAETAGSKIGRAVLADGGHSVTFQEFALPLANSEPTGITAGPDGNVWFGESFGSRGAVGRITPTGEITEFPLPYTIPGDIAAGPDGNLWFTEWGARRIGRITPAGIITEFPVPVLANGPGGPVHIAAGATDLWFTEPAVPSVVGRITTQGHVVEYTVPTGSGPFGIAADASRVWFTEVDASRIGVFDIPAVIATGADAGDLPAVRVFDSASGGLLREFLAYDPSFQGGVRVAVVDSTGDIVTAPGPGGGPHVRVFDGVTGRVKREFMAYDPAFTGGVYVAAASFVDTHYPPNSGSEIITGAGEGGGPHVKVFDVKTGAVLQSFMAYDPAFAGGVRVAAGQSTPFRPDIITGAGPGGGPHVKVFRGSDLAVTQSFFAYDPGFTGGVFVGLRGFADAPVIVTGPGAGGGPHVKTFDARTGAMLKSFFAYDAGFTGGVRVASADLNADGVFDILTAAGPGGGPIVRGFDGGTLARVDDITAYDPAFMGGIFVGGR
jgi:streptogramin lyase